MSEREKEREKERENKRARPVKEIVQETERKTHNLFARKGDSNTLDANDHSNRGRGKHRSSLSLFQHNARFVSLPRYVMEKPLSPPCPRSPPTRVAPPERYKSCVLVRAHTKRETPAIDDSTIRRSLVPSSERVKNLRVNNVNTLEDAWSFQVWKIREKLACKIGRGLSVERFTFA